MTEEVKFSPEQQAFVDKLVGDARVKAREKADADNMARAAKDKEVADQAALVAQQQWKTLAEQREVRVKTLEPLEKQVEAYDELIKGMLKDAVEGLGDAAKTAVDGLPKSMTAIEKLNWLGKNQGLFQAAGASSGVGTPGRPGRTATDQKKPTELCRFPLRL